MTVVITKESFSSFTPEDRCALCGERPHYPFLEWHGDNNLFICGQCCHTVKNGLMLDLIHVAAIIDIQKIEPAYRNYTLARELINQVEENERKRRKDILDFPGKR